MGPLRTVSILFPFYLYACAVLFILPQLRSTAPRLHIGHRTYSTTLRCPFCVSLSFQSTLKSVVHQYSVSVLALISHPFYPLVLRYDTSLLPRLSLPPSIVECTLPTHRAQGVRIVPPGWMKGVNGPPTGDQCPPSRLRRAHKGSYHRQCLRGSRD